MPALLLNDIAQRYASASRIVMEYVDNAIDDKEDEFRVHQVYPGKGLQVQILLDPKSRSLLVRDNALGMDKEKLIRVVRSIGNSSKKSISWLNGNFGFGIHAFRAAAKEIFIRSSVLQGDQSIQHCLRVHRDVSQGLDPPCQTHFLWNEELGRTGTEVMLNDIDSIWMKDLSMESIVKEVELHFESLLRRRGLRISVEERDLKPFTEMFKFNRSLPEDAMLSQGDIRECRPFDYSTVKGVQFKKRVDINDMTVMIDLSVADKEYLGHRARFFNLGRRINDVASVDSFMKLSKHKYSLWNHPQLVGMIELSGSLEPVITRDEFKASDARKKVYTVLLALEDEIKSALDFELEKYRMQSFEGMEGTLGQVLESLFRKEARGYTFIHKVLSAPPLPIYKEKNRRIPKEKTDQPEKEKKPPMFDIRFSKMPPNNEGQVKRAVMIDNIIEINVDHPDFNRRMKSRMGKPLFDDRLIGYLASVVSANFRVHSMRNKSNGSEMGGSLIDDKTTPEELVGTFAELEAALKRKLPSLKRHLESQNESQE